MMEWMRIVQRELENVINFKLYELDNHALHSENVT